MSEQEKGIHITEVMDDLKQVEQLRARIRDLEAALREALWAVTYWRGKSDPHGNLGKLLRRLETVLGSSEGQRRKEQDSGGKLGGGGVDLPSPRVV